MKVDQNIRVLLTSELLNLDPRIIDKQTVLFEVLFEVSLFRLSYPSTIEEISREVNVLVKQENFQKSENYDKIVQECLKNGTICKNGDKYELSEVRKKKFKELFSHMDSIFKVTKRGLIDSIEIETSAPLEIIISDDVFTTIMRLLTEEVYEYSIQLARNNLTIEEMIIRLESSEPSLKIENAIGKIIPNDRKLLKNQIIEGIRNYFKLLPNELKELLNFINSNLIINQILNLDPTLINLQKEWFSKRRIYLDTNVILSLFLEAHPDHSVVSEIINSSKELGVQLFISPATLIEINSQVDRARKNYHLLESNRITPLIASRGDDVILATFINLRRKQPSIEWNSFITPFNSFEEILLQNSILVENEGFSECKNNTKADPIRKAIKDSKSPLISPKVIEHDTLNFLLICQLRQTYLPDARGQVVWLLTLDRSLRNAQRILKGSGIIENPYCMQITDWGEIVLPLQSIHGFKFPDFIGYLAQARLGAFGEPDVIQLDFVETIRDAVIDVDRLWKLAPNQVNDVITKLQTSREARSLLVSPEEQMAEDEHKSKQLQFDAILDNAIQETDPLERLKDEYDKKLLILNIKIEVKDQELQETKQQLENTMVNKIKRLFSKFINLFQKRRKTN